MRQPFHEELSQLEASLQEEGALVFAQAGLEEAVGVPAGSDGGGGRPEADREAGESCRAEGGRLRDRGALDGDAEEVRLALHQEVVGAGAAVDAERVQGRGAVGGHCFHHVTRLVRD